jgi:hypothetical protein
LGGGVFGLPDLAILRFPSVLHVEQMQTQLN